MCITLAVLVSDVYFSANKEDTHMERIVAPCRQTLPMTSTPQRVALPHVLIYSRDSFSRQGLVALLSSARLSLTVAGVESLEEVAQACRRPHRPDLVIYSYSRGTASLQGALAILRQATPSIQQLVITDELQPLFMAQADRIVGLDVVGSHLSCRELCTRVLTLLFRPQSAISWLPKTPGANLCLSPRQRTLLHLLRQGKSPAAIARQLNIHHKTVSAHKMELFRRLHVRGVREVSQLLSLADELLWLTLEPHRCTGVTPCQADFIL